MKILCLGNNTEDTDLQTKDLAKQAQLPCYGLLSEFDHNQKVHLRDYVPNLDRYREKYVS